MLIDLIDINLIFEESMRLAYGASFAANDITHSQGSS